VEVDEFTTAFAGVGRAVLDGADDGFARVLVKKWMDRIVEGRSSEGGGRGGLRKIGEAYNRTRLTAGAKRALGAWLRWA